MCVDLKRSIFTFLMFPLMQLKEKISCDSSQPSSFIVLIKACTFVNLSQWFKAMKELFLTLIQL